MANDTFKVKKALNIEPNSAPNLSTDGDIGFNSSDSNLEVYTGGSVKKVVTDSQTQTLTNKTLTTPVISSISNTGTLTLPTSTDTLVGRATTDTLTNKTLTAPTIDAVTFDGQASAPANPSAGNYKVYVDDTTSKLQILDSSGTVTAIGSGAGGSLNYIENPDAEAATTGWATYADAAGTSPVDGTGGSPNVTFTRSTSSPLRGLGSFLLTKDAANRQGEGASYNFEIDSADQGKVMQITFDYAIASGTYATGDLAVYVIHDPNGTPKVIQPSGYQIENVGVNSVARLTFQTEVSAQLDYTLCFHVASTSASAYTVKLDNVQLGPQVVPLGAPVTDWVSYTPTFTGWSANVTASGKWRRVGDSLEAEVKLALSGAPTGTLTSASLPSGFVVDTAKLSQTDSGQTYNSSGSVFDTSGSKNWPMTVRYTSTTAVEPRVIAADEVIAYSGLINATQPVTFASGDTVTFNFRVPIVGWSSSTVVSSSADTRVVAARYTTAAGQTITGAGAANLIDFGTKDFDTHGAVTTGGSWKFTAPVPGIYEVESMLLLAATSGWADTEAVEITVYKNGVANQRISYRESFGSGSQLAGGSGTGKVQLNAGDYVDVRLAQLNGSSINLFGNAAYNWITISLLSGPSQIAANEVIAASYYSTAGTSITGGGGWLAVPMATKIVDTHSMVASSIATIQAPGIYELKFNLWTNGATLSTTQSAQARFVLTGSRAGNFDGYSDQGNGASKNFNIQGSITLNLLAGDTVKLEALSDVTVVLNTTAFRNTFSVTRLGGVM